MAWKLIVVLDRKTNDNITVTLKDKNDLVVDEETKMLAFFESENVQVAIPLERVHLYILEKID